MCESWLVVILVLDNTYCCVLGINIGHDIVIIMSNYVCTPHMILSLHSRTRVKLVLHIFYTRVGTQSRTRIEFRAILMPISMWIRPRSEVPLSEKFDWVFCKQHVTLLVTHREIFTQQRRHWPIHPSVHPTDSILYMRTEMITYSLQKTDSAILLS